MVAAHLARAGRASSDPPSPAAAAAYLSPGSARGPGATAPTPRRRKKKDRAHLGPAQIVISQRRASPSDTARGRRPPISRSAFSQAAPCSPAPDDVLAGVGERVVASAWPSMAKARAGGLPLRPSADHPTEATHTSSAGRCRGRRSRRGRSDRGVGRGRRGQRHGWPAPDLVDAVPFVADVPDRRERPGHPGAGPEPGSAWSARTPFNGVGRRLLHPQPAPAEPGDPPGTRPAAAARRRPGRWRRRRPAVPRPAARRRRGVAAACATRQAPPPPPARPRTPR